MQDGAIIGMAIISTLGMLAGIQLMNHNWFKREETKYKYQVKKAKLKQKGIQVTKAPPSGAIDWITTLKGVDPNILHTIIDQFGGDEVIPDGGDLTGTLVNIAEQNPELVQSFLKGLGGKKDAAEEQPPSQV